MPKAGTSQDATHDIVMTIGGTNYGFMLARGEGGAKLWDVYDSPTVSPLFTSTEPGYGNYDPEKEVAKLQSDWRGGFGRRFYADKPEYYQLGTVDARWKDKLILPPAATTTTITGSATLSGAGVVFEDYGSSFWLGCTNKLYKWDGTIWVEDKDFGTDVIKDLKAFNGLLWIALTNSSGTEINYQCTNGTTYYAATNADSKARYFAVLGNSFLKAINPNEVKIATRPQIDMTPPALTAGTPTSGGSVTDGAHKYKVTFFNSADAEQTGPSAASGEITCSGGNNTVPLSSIPLHPAPGALTITRRLYRTAAGGSDYKLLATISDNTTTTYSDTIADASLGADAPSGGADAWGSAATVGDREVNINSLTPYKTLVYAGKDDGLYSITSGGTVALVLTDFRNYRSTKNFSKVTVWRNLLFFNIGVGGIYSYDGTDYTYLGWDMLAPDVGSYAEVGAFAPGHDFLYVITAPQSAGGSATICTLRQEDVNGTVDWRWHSIQQLALMDTPVCAYVTGSYPTAPTNNPKLWVAGNDANSSPDVNKPQYMILPIIGGSPNDDTNYKYPTTIQYFYTPNYDMRFRADRKIFLAVDVISTHPSGATTTVNVSFAMDDSATWTAVESDGITAGPVTRKAIGAAGTVGRYIRFRIGLTSSANTKTPIVHGIVIRAVLRAGRRKVFEFAVRVGNDPILVHGAQGKDSVTTLATQLKNADDPATQTGVVTLYDRENTSHNVVIENLREKEVRNETNNNKTERIFYIRAVEVSVS